MRHMFSDIGKFRRDPLSFFLHSGCNSTEPLVELKVGPHPVYLVADPSLIKPIFKAEEDQIDKGRLIYKMREVIGKSSLTLSGDEHKARRAAIHAQLARGIMTSYVPQIASIVREYAAQMMAAKTFEVHPFTAGLALRVICDLLFGRNALSRGDEATLVNAVKLVEDDLAERIFRVLPDWPWVTYQKKKKLRLGRAEMSAVVERSRHKATNSSIVKSLVGLNLEDEALRDEILLIMLAGHHTTGTAMTWLLYYMATNPAICEQLVDEASEVTDSSGEVIPDRLSRATFSRSVALEILRLYPSSYWMSRETKQSLTLGGRTLKPGTSLIISPWQLHRDPRSWIAPDAFDPNRNHLANKSYCPFGAGPRACVGMGLAIIEMQLLALEFASAFRMKVISQIPPPAPKPSITLVPPPIRMELEPRSVSLADVIRTPRRAVAQVG